MNKSKILLNNIIKLANYNLKLIFANRFIYFLSASILTFSLLTLIVILNSDTIPKTDTIFNLLYLPGILLIFYPCVYGIQLDADTRMLETLFGIPNYRYKVWLVRLTLAYIVVAVLLLALVVLSHFIVAPVPIFRMVFHLLFPLFFLGCTAFMFATITHSGHGAGALMIIIGFGLWISMDLFVGTKWNLFHNPFTQNASINSIVLDEITFYNRILLFAGAILALLFGLLNLQKREKFI